jgi:hypothetical protein
MSHSKERHIQSSEIIDTFMRASFWRNVALYFIASVKESLSFFLYLIVSIFNYVAIGLVALFDWLFDFKLAKEWILTVASFLVIAYVLHVFTVFPWWGVFLLSLIPAAFRYWTLLVLFFGSLIGILLV